MSNLFNTAYFDMDTFEKNREDAKKKQEALKVFVLCIYVLLEI